MRLFTAVCFDETTKRSILSWIGVLRENAEKGRFVEKENLHLTLQFIGETERVRDLCRAIDALSFDRFTLELYGCGSFRRDRGELFYLKAQGGGLLKLESELRALITAEGFLLANKKYLPHVTLGRDVLLKPGANEIKFPGGLKTEVKSVSLMKSERIGGRLLYTGIYEKRCRGE